MSTTTDQQTQHDLDKISEQQNLEHQPSAEQSNTQIDDGPLQGAEDSGTDSHLNGPRSRASSKKRPHLQGRFSGRLLSKDDEKRLADECKLLGPLLGGIGKRGERSRMTLSKIVRAIASGEVREFCEKREAELQALTARCNQLSQQCQRGRGGEMPKGAANGAGCSPEEGRRHDSRAQTGNGTRATVPARPTQALSVAAIAASMAAEAAKEGEQLHSIPRPYPVTNNAAHARAAQAPMQPMQQRLNLHPTIHPQAWTPLPTAAAAHQGASLGVCRHIEDRNLGSDAVLSQPGLAETLQNKYCQVMAAILHQSQISDHNHASNLRLPDASRDLNVYSGFALANGLRAPGLNGSDESEISGGLNADATQLAGEALASKRPASPEFTRLPTLADFKRQRSVLEHALTAAREARPEAISITQRMELFEYISAMNCSLQGGNAGFTGQHMRPETARSGVLNMIKERGNMSEATQPRPDVSHDEAMLTADSQRLLSGVLGGTFEIPESQQSLALSLDSLTTAM